MGSSGEAVAVEGIAASIAALDALDLEDALLASGAHADAEVDALQRRYEIRLERLEIRSRLAARLMAGQVRDAADAVEFQQAMTAPDAPVHERTFAEMSGWRRSPRS
ncbi:hypothetical protein [Arthrobacter sp. SLBN-112]|uniref:hypothetical protein n=1 Tax=Arthrobacter sp. SLBN-112 TaxID=2768452 RepID=UPI0027B5F36E|nr:ElaB/YqjD/DUF883 family membrane-anchored ribosome-binding protein [Arthrobacter sp. SLBN-112]